jgi:hypothetical protein
MTIYHLETVRRSAQLGVFIVNAANEERADGESLDVTVNLGIVDHVSGCELAPDIMEKLRALDKVVFKELDGDPVHTVFGNMEAIVELLKECDRSFWLDYWYSEENPLVVDGDTTTFVETVVTLVWSS